MIEENHGRSACTCIVSISDCTKPEGHQLQSPRLESVGSPNEVSCSGTFTGSGGGGRKPEKQDETCTVIIH